MKTKRIKIATLTLGVAFAMAAFFITDAKALVDPAAKGVWTETNCVCVATGTIVGHSNNCNPGTSDCNDNNCSHTSCNN